MDRRQVAEVLKEIAGLIDDLAFLGEGHFTDAWLVNGSVVYRFAKHEEAVASLRREACLLPQIAPHLAVQIPRPRFYEISRDPPVALAAHEVIVGRPLTRRRFAALGRRPQNRCVGEIAQFLASFHQTDLALARRCGIEVRNYRSHYGEVAAGFEQHMAPRLVERDRNYILSVFDGFLAHEAAQLKSNALLHGDLSSDHILCDQENTKVTAIIDFGDMIIADPASDLAGLYENYGSEFMRALLRRMPDADPALPQRIYRLYELGWIEWAVDVFEEQCREDIELALRELKRLRRDTAREENRSSREEVNRHPSDAQRVRLFHCSSIAGS